MGSNQSKLSSLVEEQMFAKWHLARQQNVQHRKSAHVINVPVQSLRRTCATSGEDFKADVLAEMQKGWTPLCAKHGIHSEKNIRRATVVATALGALFVWGKKWQDIKKWFGDTDDEWAIRVMWTLEDEIDHPWRILRMFVLQHSYSSKSSLVHAMTQEVQEAKRLFKTQICWHCHKAKLNACALMKCSLCNIAKYCSKACQKKDWLCHKQTCATLQQKAEGSHEEEEHDTDCIDRAQANPQEAFW